MQVVFFSVCFMSHIAYSNRWGVFFLFSDRIFASGALTVFPYIFMKLIICFLDTSTALPRGISMPKQDH